MEQQEKRAAAFFGAINEDSKRRQREIVDEVNREEKSRLEAARREARRRSTEYLRHESEKLRFETGRETAALEKELKLRILKKRRDIASEVFDRVRARLAVFAASYEYESFLLKSASEIAMYFNGGEILFLLKPEDMRFAREMSDRVTQSCVFREDTSIKIGGCRAVSESSHLAADDTLDARLDAQLEWFYDNSGLTITG